MKDNLKLIYNFDIKEYEEISNGILFFYGDSYYYYVKSKLDEDYINRLYNFCLSLRKKGLQLHDFVWTKNNKLIEEECILFKVNALIEEISWNDLKVFESYRYPLNDEYINMCQFWLNKIDYLEYQLGELSANKLINNSFDYYDGLAELLLDQLKKVNFNELTLSLAHKSIDDSSSLFFYLPLNITIDCYLRDVASYIRCLNNRELISDFLAKKQLNNSELLYFFVRLSFPFKYFNLMSSLLFNEIEEKELALYLNNNDLYENYLFYLDRVFGYKVFPWLEE